MVTKSLHILLVFALLCCPIWCGLSACAAEGSSDTAVVEHICQCCRQGPPVRQDREKRPGEEPSAPSDGNSSSNCQCICGGAVFDQRDLTTPPVLDVTPTFAYIELQAYTRTALAATLAAADPPDVGITPGRYLCLLHMSLQI